jgi:hypothetical protein
MEHASGPSQTQEGIKTDGPRDLIRAVWSVIQRSRLTRGELPVQTVMSLENVVLFQ